MPTNTQTPPQDTATAPKRRRRLAGVMLAAAGLLLLAGTVTGHAMAKNDETGFTSESVRAVVVDQDAGDVTLVPGDSPGQVHVTTSRTWGWQRPTSEHTVEDGTLTIAADCPAFLNLGPCDVDQRITVPAGITVEIALSAGSITAAADVDVATLDVRTSAGTIVGDDVKVPDFSAVTNSGDVRASFAGPAPERVTARSSSGDVELTVPETVYRVDADTSSGDVRVGLTNDPQAARRISAHTSSGDVTVEHR
jgi:hypothetical protein